MRTPANDKELLLYLIKKHERAVEIMAQLAEANEPHELQSARIDAKIELFKIKLGY